MDRRRAAAKSLSKDEGSRPISPSCRSWCGSRDARAGIFGTVVGSISCDRNCVSGRASGPGHPHPPTPLFGATLTRLSPPFLLNAHVVAYPPWALGPLARYFGPASPPPAAPDNKSVSSLISARRRSLSSGVVSLHECPSLETPILRRPFS
jgi:hypothetical protein